MAARTFIDGSGLEWQAWDVQPLEHPDWSAAAKRHLPDSMASGWLCFESAREKRRVHPIPRGWESWSVEELRRYCLSAEPVQRRAPSEFGAIADPVVPAT